MAVFPEDNFVYYKYNGLLTTAPKSFVGMSERDIYDLYNGCGVGRIGGKLVPESLFGLKITYLCQIHDHMYERCCCDEDEQIADGIFAQNANNWVTGYSSPAMIWPRLSLVAWYMKGVSSTTYSEDYWELNKKEVKSGQRYAGLYSLEIHGR